MVRYFQNSYHCTVSKGTQKTETLNVKEKPLQSQSPRCIDEELCVNRQKRKYVHKPQENEDIFDVTKERHSPNLFKTDSSAWCEESCEQ